MLSGLPVIYGINPYTTETSPSHPLGTIGVTPDGRKFRYAQVGPDTALVAGTVLQAEAENTSDQALTAVAASVGATSVSTSSTVTVTANEYADGYLVVTVTPDLGSIYRIKSHPAATSGTLELTLFNGIKVAWTTATRFDLVKNPYKGVIINPTTPTGLTVGVAFVAAAVNTYTWIQTGGVANVLQDGATSVGTGVVASNGTPGAVEDVASTTQAIVGTAVTGIASGENGAVYLLLD